MGANGDNDGDNDDDAAPLPLAAPLATKRAKLLDRPAIPLSGVLLVDRDSSGAVGDARLLSASSALQEMGMVEVGMTVAVDVHVADADLAAVAAHLAALPSLASELNMTHDPPNRLVSASTSLVISIPPDNPSKFVFAWHYRDDALARRALTAVHALAPAAQAAL